MAQTSKVWMNLEYLSLMGLERLTKFDLYHNNNTGMHSNYKYSWALPFEKLNNPVEITHVLQQIWFFSIPASIMYYWFMKKIQAAMRDRPPFRLTLLLFLWNASLALFSAVALFRFSEDFIQTWKTYGFTYTVCRTCNPDDVAGFWSFAFGASKIVELGDTMFIVLRKKPLIFLHYYHHAAVLIYSSHSAAEHAAPAQIYGIMNLVAHAIMYTYYAYTATGKRPYKWISMSVTTIQTTQMFLGVLVTCYVYYLKVFRPDIPCQQSMSNLYLAFFLYLTFAILFVQFFVNAYIKKINKHYYDIKAKKIE
ncbi:Elongation of very long chain fatty acids protein [Aphelenchoides bicaudatus]|nr:Elongation of very long chain fatty acids protein [Aphelenchoides bicaudatus]